MNIIILSNAITPHQVPLCDSLKEIPNVTVLFIETQDIDKTTLPVGWRNISKRDYVISYASFISNRTAYDQLILAADVVVFGSAPVQYVQHRLEAGKLTFLYSERIYKNWKECLKMPLHYIKFRKMFGKYGNLHLLCASAFAASDYSKLGLFKGKAYKWGYFTETDLDLPSLNKRFKSPLKILWCSRFIEWKHPELAVKLAKRLRDSGYTFMLDMIGEGDKLQETIRYVEENDLGGFVRFLGTMPNKQVHEQMQLHDIFLFTSDKGEGWGAVANEAMANGCVIVGSDEIGAIPYLVTHRGNGIIFKSKNEDLLYKVVVELLQDVSLCQSLSYNAVATMREIWSPRNAASSLIELSNSIIKNSKNPILAGPCSKA
ncbi:hypothetical protein CIK92_08175 [Prevotella sp. P4-67]|uniref:glycosyltransferase family 4 protein n=1 Tax=Prevotella sp. P4-67 TaxID=2024227 RepID=UPI000B979D92|nr:glycosyltransferase family 4 protein [Prevotella sp. P4-67]OYP71457.1 hypothetical protein CIK92_08175 [Prevotella sp. P4-67]